MSEIVWEVEQTNILFHEHEQPPDSYCLRNWMDFNLRHLTSLNCLGKWEEKM